MVTSTALLRQRQIEKAVQTVNEELLDAAIRHSVFIERLKTHEVNKIVGLLNQNVLPDALSNLEARLRKIEAFGFDPGPVTTKRLQEALGSTNEILRGGIRGASKTLQNDLKDIAVSEAEWQVRVLEKATKGLDLSFVTPSAQTLNSIVTSQPMRGRLLKDWWSGISRSAQEGIQTQLNLGLAQGESIPQIARRIRGTAERAFKDGVYNSVRKNVESTVRTSVNHVSTQAREETYKENDSVIKGVQYVATLDSRTTRICAGLDGEVFKVDEGPRPPQHHQCRSTTSPVTKSWEELGIDLKEAPPGTRQSMNGRVPAQTTFGEWLKKQPIKTQEEVLGKGGAKLFREGKVNIKSFSQVKGVKSSSLSLNQVRRNEGLKPLLKKPGERIQFGPPIKKKTPAQIVDKTSAQLWGSTAAKSQGDFAARLRRHGVSEKTIEDLTLKVGKRETLLERAARQSTKFRTGRKGQSLATRTEAVKRTVKADPSAGLRAPELTGTGRETTRVNRRIINEFNDEVSKRYGITFDLRDYDRAMAQKIVDNVDDVFSQLPNSVQKKLRKKSNWVKFHTSDAKLKAIDGNAGFYRPGKQAVHYAGDLSRQVSSLKTRQIIIHEYGHHLDKFQKFRSKKEWRELWTKIEFGEATKVTTYGTKSTAELVSESIQQFFTRPKILKKRNPEAFKLLDDFFEKPKAVPKVPKIPKPSFTNLQKAWVKDLTEDEHWNLINWANNLDYVEAVHKVQATGRLPQELFKRLNKAFPDYWDSRATVLKQIDQLDSVLQKAPNFKGTVYRGVRVSQSQYNKFLNSRFVDIPTLSSSSIDKEVAEQFAAGAFTRGDYAGLKVVLKLETKSGSLAKGIDDFWDDVEEVVLGRNTRYEVTGTRIAKTNVAGITGVRPIEYLEVSAKEVLAKAVPAVKKSAELVFEARIDIGLHRTVRRFKSHREAEIWLGRKVRGVVRQERRWSGAYVVDERNDSTLEFWTPNMEGRKPWERR